MPEAYQNIRIFSERLVKVIWVLTEIPLSYIDFEIHRF